MSNSKAVVGVFGYLDDAIKAIEIAKKKGVDYRVYSPMARHELEEATMPEKSPVRFVTLTGALTGITFGFALAIMCSMDWPMRASAKNIVSVPGFFVIGYECTILFGAIFTLLAMIKFCGLPDLLRKVGYDERFSLDKFGVVLACDSNDVDSFKKNLMEVGAEEVEVRDAL